MRLTFCCLHSLQAFRLPPRRLPVTGGVFSISTESGLLCMKSTPTWGRGSWGDRKSVGGIKCGPFGAIRFRYSKSIRIGLRLPDIKPQRTRSTQLVGFNLPEIGEIKCLKGGATGVKWSRGGRPKTLIRQAVERNSAVPESSCWPSIPGEKAVCQDKTFSVTGNTWRHRLLFACL